MPSELGRWYVAWRHMISRIFFFIALLFTESRLSLRSYFEEGSEAKIVHTLTDTQTVSAQLCNDGWTGKAFHRLFVCSCHRSLFRVVGMVEFSDSVLCLSI
jgi:hypothetical protein